MTVSPFLSEDEERRIMYLSACIGLRNVLASFFEIEDEELISLTEECVETVFMSVGWPLSPPWWGLD